MKKTKKEKPYTIEDDMKDLFKNLKEGLDDDCLYAGEAIYLGDGVYLYEDGSMDEG